MVAESNGRCGDVAKFGGERFFTCGVNEKQTVLLGCAYVSPLLPLSRDPAISINAIKRFVCPQNKRVINDRR